MKVILLDTDRVNCAIGEIGLIRSSIYKQLEISQTTGGLLLTYGIFPRSGKERILNKLSEILRIPVPELTKTLVEKKDAA